MFRINGLSRVDPSTHADLVWAMVFALIHVRLRA